MENKFENRIWLSVEIDRLSYKLNGSAQEALNQIKDKGCAKPYAADSRKVIALGINFSSEKGTIDEFISSN